jgi:hypothetical protein
MEQDKETEADGIRAGKLRLLKARHQSEALKAQTRELLQSQKDAPWKMSSTSREASKTYPDGFMRREDTSSSMLVMSNGTMYAQG